MSHKVLDTGPLRNGHLSEGQDGGILGVANGLAIRLPEIFGFDADGVEVSVVWRKVPSSARVRATVCPGSITKLHVLSSPPIKSDAEMSTNLGCRVLKLGRSASLSANFCMDDKSHDIVQRARPAVRTRNLLKADRV